MEYLSNFYANLEYNLSPVSIRIETVDTLGINRESLSAAINSNTGDNRRTHFSPAVLSKCVNHSTELQSQTVLDQACIVSEANKTHCASISSMINFLVSIPILIKSTMQYSIKCFLIIHMSKMI